MYALFFTFLLLVPLISGTLGGILFVAFLFLDTRIGHSPWLTSEDFLILVIFIFFGWVAAALYATPFAVLGSLAAAIQLRRTSWSPRTIGYVTAFGITVVVAIMIAVCVAIAYSFDNPLHFGKGNFPLNWRTFESNQFVQPYYITASVLIAIFFAILWSFALFRRVYLKS